MLVILKLLVLIMNRGFLSIYNLTYCAIFTALIAIGAFIQIPLPYLDYFTLQFLFVLLAGIVLGSKLGGLSVLTYVIIGLIGIPIFAGGGGIGYIFKTSFGYLLGFIISAYLTGLIIEKSNRNYYLAVMAGLMATYVIGLSYKYFILNYYLQTPISFKLVLLSCFPIDLPCDIILCILAIFIAKKLEKAGGLYVSKNIRKSFK